MIIRVDDDGWMTVEENCLLKRFAIDSCLVRVLEPNLMGLFGGGFALFHEAPVPFDVGFMGGSG